MLVRINHHEPQQVRAGTERKRQVVLHEPLGQAVLRAGHACGTGGHGKLLSGTVRDDTPPHARKGRHLLHLYGGEAHLVQPVLHG